MTAPQSAPTRLLGLRPGDDPAGLARLVRSSVNAPKDSVPSLKGRIRSTLRRRSAWRRRYVRAGVIGVIIFLAGGVVGAVVQPIVRFHRQHKLESIENVYPATASRTRGHRPRMAPPADPAFADEHSLAELPGPEDPADLAWTWSAPGAEQPMAELPSSGPAADPAASPGSPGAGAAGRETAGAGAAGAGAAKTTAALPSPHALAAPSSPRAPAYGSTAPARPALDRAQGSRARGPWATPASRAEARPESPTVRTPARHVDEGHRALAMIEPPRQTEPRPGTPTPAAPRAAYAATLPAAVAPRVPAPAAPALAPAPAQPAASEQVLLARALHSLRSQRRPDQALVILDQYAARFPNGSLAPEAARLRTETLLALGQKPAALAELNRDLGSGTVGAEENRLVRGELHAGAGRWQDALLDFDAVARARLARDLGATTSSSAKLRDHLERALWGRACARSHLGDHAGAAADLREYLQRFPRGRFAAQAGHLLGELR